MDGRSSGTVLHVISSMGLLGGGTERQLLLYFQHRSPQWRHVVAYRKPYTRLNDAVERTGVRTVWLGSGGFFRHLGRLIRLAREESADVIHTHLFEANHLGRVAGRVLGVPVITTITNTLEPQDRIASREYRRPWKYRLALALESLTARLGTFRFIAISEAVRDSAVRTLRIDRRRVRLIYRAVEPAALNGVRPPRQAPLLVSTGRLVPHKAHDLLIRMLPLLQREWPGTTLQVLGRGPERGNLGRLAEGLDLAGQVRFLDEWVPDVNDVLREADVFLFASWFDGFANGFAEGVAAGLPVVAVELPVLKEIAPRGSVLLVERSERALAGAVSHVLSNLDAFRAVAQEEAVRFCQRFTIERYVTATEALYAEAAQERARG